MAAPSPSHPSSCVLSNDCLSRNSTIYRPLIVDDQQHRAVLPLFECLGRNNHLGRAHARCLLCHLFSSRSIFKVLFQVVCVSFLGCSYRNAFEWGHARQSGRGVDSWYLLTAGVKGQRPVGSLGPSGVETLSVIRGAVLAIVSWDASCSLGFKLSPTQHTHTHKHTYHTHTETHLYPTPRINCWANNSQADQPGRGVTNQTLWNRLLTSQERNVKCRDKCSKNTVCVSVCVCVCVRMRLVYFYLHVSCC